MNVLLYHSKRKDHITTANSLAAYSVVITSYTMLANECGSIVTSKGSSELIDLASDDEDSGGVHQHTYPSIYIYIYIYIYIFTTPQLSYPGVS
jgi:hypothetical protein